MHIFNAAKKIQLPLGHWMRFERRQSVAIIHFFAGTSEALSSWKRILTPYPQFSVPCRNGLWCICSCHLVISPFEWPMAFHIPFLGILKLGLIHFIVRSCWRLTMWKDASLAYWSSGKSCDINEWNCLAMFCLWWGLHLPTFRFFKYLWKSQKISTIFEIFGGNVDKVSILVL